MNTISVSQIQAFNQCPQKWAYQYDHGLSLKYQETSPASLGTMVHVGIASAWRVWAKIQDREDRHSDENIERLQQSVAYAIEKWVKENQPTSPIVEIEGMSLVDAQFADDWKEASRVAIQLAWRTVRNLFQKYRVVYFDGKPMIEYRLDFLIPDTQTRFTGYVDAILENTDTGHIELVDWKTTTRYKDEYDLSVDQQLAIYQYAVSYITDGKVIPTVSNYYQISPDLPNKPLILKKGGVSVDKSCKTDWETYAETVLENFDNDPSFAGSSSSYDVDDTGSYKMMCIIQHYGINQGMIEKLSKYEWVKPIITYRNLATQARFWTNFVRSLEHLQNTIDEAIFPKVLSSFSCSRCQFFKLCSGEMEGLDVDEIIAMEYEVRNE